MHSVFAELPKILREQFQVSSMTFVLEASVVENG
jgi:hypothetical protein